MHDVADGLRRRRCAPCDRGTAPLAPAQIAPLLQALPGWVLDNGAVTKIFRFGDYHETLAFVNATAWISHREDHHPALEVGYNQCKVSYITDAINGLSDNDFICAAKLESLFEL